MVVERTKVRSPLRALWIERVGLSVLLLVLVAAFSAIPVIHDFEVRVSDTFFRLAPVPAHRSEVILVLIDDESLMQYGRWPWSRELLGELVNKIADSGASVIGLDILLSEPQSMEADAALQKSLRTSQRVVIVGKIGAFQHGNHWVEPLPAFAGAAAAVGHAHAVLDEDSICRRYPPLEMTIDGPRWAFALEVARRTNPLRASAFMNLYGIHLADDSADVVSAKPLLVRIPFRSDEFETISASTVFRGRDLRVRLSGHPVLIGFGGTEIIDRLSTPLATELPVPGIEVHAQILDGVLTERWLREVPASVGALLLAFTCVIVVIVFRKWHGWASMGLLIGLAATVYALSFLTFVWMFWIVPAGAMLFAVVSGPLLVYAADFARVEHSVNRQLVGLRSWLTERGNDFVERGEEDLSWKLTLLQELETELGSLYELHKALLESTQDPVATFNEKGNLLLHNHAFSTALALVEPGLTLEQLRARCIPKDDVTAMSSRAGQELEVSLNNTPYSLRTMSLPSTRLSPGGGTLVTLMNLQARVDRDRARAEALAFITHELRTPLASIQGFADLLTRYPDSPECDGAAETILWESKRLLALISSYLDVLRLDAGAKPIRTTLLNLNDVVSQVFDVLRPLATAADMRLVLEGDVGTVMLGDANLINGAVLNLISNAIKYGKPGTPVEVHCSYSDDEAIVSVLNQGSPIASEDVPRLFDPYYRVRESEAAKPGWGLGLAFVKRIAEKHGGSVQVKSNQTGTLFEIHLPSSVRATDPSEVIG
jgi:signal transduction histidine kinase